ncbi:MAG: hypothetical protein ABIF19_01675 [Planctomycetota bacterium]
MNRRKFIKDLALAAAVLPSMGGGVHGASNADMTQDWLVRWEKNILGRARSRYCDKEMSEEIGWLMSPFLNGFYYGYRATGDAKWVVFTKEDIQRLIATNRNFMWNQQVTGARFQRIDGGRPDPRWKNSPGVLWTALVAYDETLRNVFIANHNPSGWGGLAATPRFLTRETAKQKEVNL